MHKSLFDTLIPTFWRVSVDKRLFYYDRASYTPPYFIDYQPIHQMIDGANKRDMGVNIFL